MLDCYETCILISRLSDNFPIVTFIPYDKIPHSPLYSITRDFSEHNITRFKNNLSNISWNETYASNETQESYDNFSKTFLDLYDIFFPATKKKFNRNMHKVEKWFTTGLLISRQRKNLLAKNAFKNPSTENCEFYKKIRNMYNTVIRLSKKLFFEQELKKHQSNLKVTWDILKKAIRKSAANKNVISSIKINGEVISDAKLIANNFNVFFTSIANSITEEIHPTVRPPEYEVEDDKPEFTCASTPITVTEFKNVVGSLKSKKSEDFNGISMYFLKNVIDSIATPLIHIFNLSFAQGVVPSQLKIAKIIPIFKSGDPLSVDNYRPISLLSSFSKILEKIMCNRLTKHLELNNLICTEQFGFRKKHSTFHPVIHLLNSITESSNQKKVSIAIFCDLRKAFDMCNGEILCKKLPKFGIKGVEQQWFRSYLSSRKQYVNIDGVDSDLLVIDKGVPQGSVLGPILFLMYINDLPGCSLLKILLFADDTTLFASADTIQELTQFVNVEFQKVVSFFRSHEMALHPSKTKFMLFNCTENQILLANPQIYIDNNNEGENDPKLISKIERVGRGSDTPAIKFLGIHIDPALNFQYHIKQISNKIARSMYAIQSAKNILTPNALKSLYYALVHSHLVYGIQIWSVASQNSLNQLIVYQKKCVRIITQAKYRSHTEPLFKKTEILRLQDMILYFKLLFMYDYLKGLLPLSFCNKWISNAQYRLNSNSNDDGQRLLRNDYDLHVPFIRLESYVCFPLSDFPRTWNNFDNQEIKNVVSRNIFKKKLKEHFIASLSDIIVCNRLLCPSCHLQI